MTVNQDDQSLSFSLVLMLKC